MPHLPDRHTSHDLALVAAFAADDAAGADRELAATLVRDCAACGAVAAELTAIARATAALPAPRRRRDYRLTAEQAARLRPTGLRRLLGAFASRRFAFAMPVGGTLATLGLVALLVTALPGSLLGTAMVMDMGAAPYGAPADGVAAGDGAAPEAQSHAPAIQGEPILRNAEESFSGGDFSLQMTEITQARGLDEVVVILAGAAILVGLGLVLLRWSSRRLV